MPDHTDKLLRELLDEVRQIRRERQQQNKTIMEAITAFAKRVNDAFDAISTSVDGLTDDVAFLKEQIAALQNSPGTITPEDQATLDGVQARVDVLAGKLAALDSTTSRPPTPTP